MDDGQNKSAAMKQEIPDELRTQINAYLFRWVASLGAILGVVNVGAIVVGLAYIFFVIPEKAASEAKVFVEKKAEEPISELRKSLMQIAAEALSIGGEAKGMSRSAAEEAERTKKALNELQQQASTLKGGDVLRVVEAAEALKGKPDIAAALRTVQQVDELSRKVATLESRKPRLRFENLSNSKDEPQNLTRNLGAYAFCALSRAGESHSNQACTCTVKQEGGSNWELSLNLATNVNGRCNCGAVCMEF
ncbi:MAG: hypothetical protein H6932_17810 [Burkholderiaceae bacterium]|nr:hypothetical protein [Burkholderiaceae bacterium]